MRQTMVMARVWALRSLAKPRRKASFSWGTSLKMPRPWRGSFNAG
jgi:hypothetical protein